MSRKSQGILNADIKSGKSRNVDSLLNMHSTYGYAVKERL